MMIKLSAACMLLQMGGSLGDNSKHTGLMQIKSLAQSGASSRKATLAEFEKYAEQVAQRYSQDPPVEQNKKGLDQEVRNAIGIIVEYIDQMYGELESYHKDDLNDAKCPGAEGCFDEYFSKDTIESIDEYKTEVITKREAHLNCRNHLKSSCQNYPYSNAVDWLNPVPEPQVALLQTDEVSASRSRTLSTDHCNSEYCEQMVEDGQDYCLAYDNYRRSAENVVPECMSSGDGQDFSDSFIKAPEGGDDLQSMETCLAEQTKNWFDPLWDAYLKCQCRRCTCVQLPPQCKDKQDSFEIGLCSAQVERSLKCEAFTTCWNGHFDKCQADGEVCTQIQTNVIGRKTDNETGERIRCLLKVLNDTTDIRVDMLMGCKDAEYNTDFWNIACPDGLSCDKEPPVSCEDHPIPCEDDFLKTEYTDKKLWAPFNEEKGNFEQQVGECKECHGVGKFKKRKCPDVVVNKPEPASAPESAAESTVA